MLFHNLHRSIFSQMVNIHLIPLEAIESSYVIIFRHRQ